MYKVISKSSKLGISLVELPLELHWVDPSTVKIDIQSDPTYYSLNDQPKNVLSGVVDYKSLSTAEVIHEIYPDKWKSDAREVKFDMIHYAVIHGKVICSVVTELSENLLEFFKFIEDGYPYSDEIISSVVLGEGSKTRISWRDSHGNLSILYPSLPKYYLSIVNIHPTTKVVSEVFEGYLVGKKTGPFDIDYYINPALRRSILDMNSSSMQEVATLGDLKLALSYVSNTNKFNDAKWNDLFDNTISKYSSVTTSIREWWKLRFKAYEESVDSLVLKGIPSSVIPIALSSDITLYHLVLQVNELIVEVLGHSSNENQAPFITEYVMSLIKYLYKVLPTHDSTNLQKYLVELPR